MLHKINIYIYTHTCTHIFLPLMCDKRDEERQTTKFATKLKEEITVSWDYITTLILKEMDEIG